MKKPFFVSVPHAGEILPPEAHWLEGLEELILMCDVDRFVDQLYQSAIHQLGLPHVFATYHRYVVDLNRLPGDVDQASLEGAEKELGQFTQGLHWSKTTRGQTLIREPLSKELHQKIMNRCYWPFHNQIKSFYSQFKEDGYEKVYHLDAHSMPSLGTSAHRDPGKERAEVVVSDVRGQSCEERFRDIVVQAYRSVGFEVALNWPYLGGAITRSYGLPSQGQHAIQVELNRKIYMNEETKQLDALKFKKVSSMITEALKMVYEEL